MLLVQPPIKALEGQEEGLFYVNKHLATKIDESIFPGIQGGPQNHTIAGLAIALREANTKNFKQYQVQVLKNSQALANSLKELGYLIRGEGTKNHMVIWDMRPLGMSSVFFDKACNFASITLNAVRIGGELEPNAVRVGSMACTTRGFNEGNMANVAEYLHLILKRTIYLKENTHGNLNDFICELNNDPEMFRIKSDVERYAEEFPIPGL